MRAIRTISSTSPAAPATIHRTLRSMPRSLSSQLFASVSGGAWVVGGSVGAASVVISASVVSGSEDVSGSDDVSGSVVVSGSVDVSGSVVAGAVLSCVSAGVVSSSFGRMMVTVYLEEPLPSLAVTVT